MRTTTVLRSAASSLLALAAIVAVGFLLIAGRTSPSVGSVGVGAASDPTGNPTVAQAVGLSLAPAEPPGKPDGPCLNHVTTFDGLPKTTEMSTKISTAVVVATVDEVGPGRWRTAGELPPGRDGLEGFNVMRLVRFSVDPAALDGPSRKGSLVAWIPGGSVACHQFLVDGYPENIKPGDRFALFLDDSQKPVSTLAGVPRVLAMWPVEGTDVATEAEGSMKITDLDQQVKDTQARPK